MWLPFVRDVGVFGRRIGHNLWLYMVLGDLVWSWLSYSWYTVSLAEELAIFSRVLPEYWRERFSVSAARLRARFMHSPDFDDDADDDDDVARR